MSVIVTSPAIADPMGSRENGLILLWLATWAISVGSFAVQQWWVVAFCAASLWFLTWRVASTQKAALSFLRPIRVQTAGLSALLGAALLLLFYLWVQSAQLPVRGHVPLALAVWSTFISPVNEELVFRGLLYRGIEAAAARFLDGWCVPPLVILTTGVLFGLAHGRESVFLAMTILAGVLYGLLRWRFKSVYASICCHMAYNALALLLLGR